MGALFSDQSTKVLHHTKEKNLLDVKLEIIQRFVDTCYVNINPQINVLSLHKSNKSLKAH